MVSYHICCLFGNFTEMLKQLCIIFSAPGWSHKESKSCKCLNATNSLIAPSEVFGCQYYALLDLDSTTIIRFTSADLVILTFAFDRNAILRRLASTDKGNALKRQIKTNKCAKDALKPIRLFRLCTWKGVFNTSWNYMWKEINLTIYVGDFAYLIQMLNSPCIFWM